MANESSPLLRNGNHAENSYSQSSLQLDQSHHLNGSSVSVRIANDERFYMGVDKRTLLNTPECGLSTVEASRRLKIFGANELVRADPSVWRQLLMEFRAPRAALLWVAIALEIGSVNISGAAVLVVLQLLYGVWSCWDQIKTTNAVAALKASLKPEALVIRDGVHQTINASLLVPGDRVTLVAGATVPADCDICEGGSIQVDQGILTGESFPVMLTFGDNVKATSTVVRGEVDALVTATGLHTFYAKTAQQISSSREIPHFQRIVLRLAIGLFAMTLFVVTCALGHLLYSGDSPISAMVFTLVLLVIAAPMTMPAACTSMMAAGSRILSDGKAIVTRLESIELLASMDVLCSDKTGTLTRNKMELQDDLPIFYPTASREDILVTAALAAKWKEPPRDAVDTLVLNAIDLRPLDQYTLLEHSAFDPSAKRTESTIRGPTGRIFKVTKGAPQTVLALSYNVEDIRDAVESKVLDLARRGIRSLAVARTDDVVGGKWLFLGIITFLDPPRHDTKRMIERAHEAGVTVKMITGDQAAIAVETCRLLGMGTTILGSDALPVMRGYSTMPSGIALSASRVPDCGAVVESADGFAQLYPEHKATVVDVLSQRGWRCGMTGVSVDDTAALKKAHVGIALDGSTDAAQAAADVVLAKPGLGVIVNAVLVAREIFQRTRNFVGHQFVGALHLLIFFTVSVLFFRPDGCRFAHFVPTTGSCFDLSVDNSSESTDHPHHEVEIVGSYFRLPVVALVLLAIFRDVTARTLVHDKLAESLRPERWNLPRLIGGAAISAAVAACTSLLLLYWALDSWNKQGVLSAYNIGHLTYDQVMMMVYLELSISSVFGVYSSRCERFFFSRPPTSLLLVVSAISVMFATTSALIWPFQEMQALSFRAVLFVWVYGVLAFLVRDFAKMVAADVFRGLANHGVVETCEVAHRYGRQEAQRENRIRLGAAYSGGESTMRDSFVAGRAVRSSMEDVPGRLEQALDRLGQLDAETKSLRQVIQTATGAFPLGPKRTQ